MFDVYYRSHGQRSRPESLHDVPILKRFLKRSSYQWTFGLLQKFYEHEKPSRSCSQLLLLYDSSQLNKECAEVSSFSVVVFSARPKYV